ncbi:hypothetical protein QJS10_CPA10g02038 [Acorus calamus]|uniref:Uncharacterized protein n=1 Tax=Acorus calamus TaxID=4465 RepID=A0AAV9DXG6_ACOCL|nr:hypothetical protein QJS10_CPA10g02038 [Acorus calamus]
MVLDVETADIPPYLDEFILGSLRILSRRGLVTQSQDLKRRRLLIEGYDLDMSYITDRLLAMSFPAERMRAIYRNPLWQVKDVLDMRHSGHYKAGKGRTGLMVCAYLVYSGMPADEALQMSLYQASADMSGIGPVYCLTHAELLMALLMFPVNSIANLWRSSRVVVEKSSKGIIE